MVYIRVGGSDRRHRHVLYVCVLAKGEQNDMSSWVSVLWLWLCVDLSPKLNFHSLLPLLSSSLLPQPLSSAHCQALLFSHGRLLREHAHICGFRGWQQSVLRLSSFFTPTYPSTQIELFSHFLSSPLNHVPILYLPIMSNFIVESARARHQVLFLSNVVAHTE